jgi:carbamoyltransferase
LFVKSKFERIFGFSRIKNEQIDKRHKDIACSLQRVTEELIFSIVEKAYKLTGSSNITIAGGVAQNSVANGKIIKNTSFNNLYIPSAGHDAGIAMGSAQYYYFNELNQPRVEALYNANLGIQFSNHQIGEKLKELNLECRFLEDDFLFQYLANKIASDKVIGFFDGAAEFGPRALGGRSILADPRNINAKELLNLKIKRRESFRPFAPSILKEYVVDYFTKLEDVPFMEKVFPIKPEKHKEIPAVTHVDGTGRLQTVSKEKLRKAILWMWRNR